MKYKIYFEFFGKKMVCEIKATNENEAKFLLKEKINIHKIEPIKENNDNVGFDKLMDMFNLK